MGITLKLNEEGKTRWSLSLVSRVLKKISLTNILFYLEHMFDFIWNFHFFNTLYTDLVYWDKIRNTHYFTLLSTLISYIYVFCYPSYLDLRQRVSIVIVTESPSDIKKSKKKQLYVSLVKTFYWYKSILTSRIRGSNCGNYAWTFNSFR